MTLRPVNRSKQILIVVDDVYQSLGKLLGLYNHQAEVKPGIADSAVVAQTAKLGNNVGIDHQSVIGEKLWNWGRKFNFSSRFFGKRCVVVGKKL